MKIRELDYEEFERQRKKMSPNEFKPYKSNVKNGIKTLSKIKKYEGYKSEKDILLDFLRNKKSNNMYLKEEFNKKNSHNKKLYSDMKSGFEKYKEYMLEGNSRIGKKLLEEFKSYVENTDWNNHNWYKELKDSCKIMQKIKDGIGDINTLEEFEGHLRNKTENKLKTLSDFMYKYIFDKNNWIADVGQGRIKKSTTNPHEDEIKANFNKKINVLLRILRNENSNESDDLIKKLLTVENGRKYNYKAVRFRFLTALYPEQMTTIASEEKINELINKIKNKYKYNLEATFEDILECHKWLIEQLSESNEDIYKKQIFYWNLYNKLIDKDLNIEIDTEEKESNMENIQRNNEIKRPLNQILYGPPGTGKTYNTINKALEIIDNEFYLKNQNNREILKEKFEEYKVKKQIEFITFHQSYGYEEFVEGIKAIPVGKEGNETQEMIYDVVDGVFKRLSKEAKVDDIEYGVDSEFDNLFGNYINKLDYIDSENSEGKELKTKIGKKFSLYRNENSIIVYANNNSKLSISRDVFKKLFLTGEVASLKSYVPIILEDILDGEKIEINSKVTRKNYVLIIDEINRGNISKIFGELITLIEDSKRLVGEEELEITLPYSGEKFGVPNNLYILGTMNTADRSIALMDTALRRRFDFEEMMPNHNLTDISIDIEGINLQEFLRVINQRVEYLYDRDHMIGHAYFIGLETKEELDEVMRNKIIPLLQEYFYDDWEKIQIVLGDHEKQKYEISLDNIDRFIVAKKLKDEDILGFNYDEIEEDVISYKINPKFTDTAYMIYEEE